MIGTRMSAAVALALVMLAGCSGDVSSPVGQPGAEITELPSPTVEATDSGEETDNDGGRQGTSVELPGLPIGGSEIQFSEPSRQCADVNLTG